ncbi:MAG TPA: thiol:disulfide interchange protein DsbA/DsbL [Burkholderiales bacterium]|jgi:thiol:disulfide interchange protein DsbA|nr:thiol:disulfide interchange protein DsbA/DsbL [Burkholderiales bacterium]
MRFPQWFFRSLSLLVLLGACLHAQGQVRPRVIDPPLAPLSGVLGNSPKDKIEVIQFFYYGCPHCFDQQPLIEDWLATKPADVEFRYIPALRDDKWLPLTRAFFALQILGAEQRLHRPIYDVINFDGVMLSEEDKLFDWVARNGVERAKFIEVYNSDEVKARVEAARKATEAYGIKATPTLVVAGKYAVTSGLAGSHYEAMRLLNQLIVQARQEKAK